jgi:Co/Zn/Cd efflux system component
MWASRQHNWHARICRCVQFIAIPQANLAIGHCPTPYLQNKLPSVTGLAHGHSHSHGGGHGHAHGGNKQEDHGHAHGDTKVKKKVLAGVCGHGPDGYQNNEYRSVHLQKKERLCDVNMWGVFIHYAGDMLSSTVVLGMGFLIHFVHDRWTLYIDPISSLAIVSLILWTTIPLVKDCSMILLQSTPRYAFQRVAPAPLL